MKTRSEGLLLWEKLLRRLKAAQGDLAEAKERWGYTGEGGYVAHLEGRIEGIREVLHDLEKAKIDW